MLARGQYGVLTSFFLVVVIIGLMIFLAYFSSLRVAQPNYIIDQYTSNLNQMTTAHDLILSCLKEVNDTTLLADEATASCLPPTLKGYNIAVFPLYNCVPMNWTIGSLSSCTAKISFLVNINQNQTCLGRMVLCR